MRRPIIAGNWKMYKTAQEAVAFVTLLQKELGTGVEAEVIVAPCFVALVPVADRLRTSAIAVAAQDCFWAEQGAYTGEVSPLMLRDAGCSYVIIGHSERRASFYETDEEVNKKALALLAHGLTPIICVGESLTEREGGATFTKIEGQVKAALQGIDRAKVGQLVIAYEPIWAIGTGKTATPEQAEEVHAFIRKLVAKIAGQEAADAVRIQYGGSVKPDNIDTLMAQPDIDGALVGGASLEAASFVRIVKFQKR
jgi:triosephosphate isomerase